MLMITIRVKKNRNLLLYEYNGKLIIISNDVYNVRAGICYYDYYGCGGGLVKQKERCRE